MGVINLQRPVYQNGVNGIDRRPGYADVNLLQIAGAVNREARTGKAAGGGVHCGGLCDLVAEQSNITRHVGCIVFRRGHRAAQLHVTINIEIHCLTSIGGTDVVDIIHIVDDFLACQRPATCQRQLIGDRTFNKQRVVRIGDIRHVLRGNNHCVNCAVIDQINLFDIADF